jgi:hypothetical protein
MPETTKEEKKALLGNFNMIPAPVKSLLGPKIKEAENYVNSLIRYAVLPAGINNNVALVSLMYSSRKPPVKVRPLYDLDDLRIIAYVLIKAYNNLKPSATALDFIKDIFQIELTTSETSGEEATQENTQEEPTDEKEEEESPGDNK